MINPGRRPLWLVVSQMDKHGIFSWSHSWQRGADSFSGCWPPCQRSKERCSDDKYAVVIETYIIFYIMNSSLCHKGLSLWAKSWDTDNDLSVKFESVSVSQIRYSFSCLYKCGSEHSLNFDVCVGLIMNNSQTCYKLIRMNFINTSIISKLTLRVGLISDVTLAVTKLSDK